MQRKLMIWMNRIAYLFFGGVWAVAYCFYRQNAFLMNLWIIFLLGISDIGVAWYLRKKVTLHYSFDRTKCQKGTPVTLRIQLKNPTIFLSRNVFLELTMENTFAGIQRQQCLIMPLYFRGKTEMTVSCTGTCCGFLQGTVTEYAISGLLGLACFRKYPEASAARMTLLPKLLEAGEREEDRREGAGEEEAVSTEKKGEEVSEVIGLRPLEAGDRQQRIHWKLSTKTEDYLVREYGTLVSTEQVLFPDLKKEAADAVVELFFSMGLACLNRGIHYRVLLWQGDRFVTEPVCSEEDLSRILDLLYEQGTRAGSLLEEYRQSSPGEEGAVLYFGAREEAAQLEKQGMGEQLCYREAVAVWL